jgi:hypothetical protein
LVDIFRSDKEQGVSRRGNDDPLDGNIMSLEFEGKFGKMMDLGKEIQGQTRLPESNFIALVQEHLPEP